MMEKQTDSAAKIANLRQCTPKSGTSASLFFMPDLVKPQYTHGVLDQTTNISCLTTSSQTITYSQAISKTTTNISGGGGGGQDLAREIFQTMV